MKCYKCGFCCTRAVCAYGEWDKEKKQCIHLTKDMLCSIYNKVKDDKVNPAMGDDCCSVMNEFRLKKMQECGDFPSDLGFTAYVFYLLNEAQEEMEDDKSSTSQRQ